MSEQKTTTIAVYLDDADRLWELRKDRTTRGLVYLLLSIVPILVLSLFKPPLSPLIVIDLIFIRMVVFAVSVHICLLLETHPSVSKEESK